MVDKFWQDKEMLCSWNEAVSTAALIAECLDSWHAGQKWAEAYHDQVLVKHSMLGWINLDLFFQLFAAMKILNWEWWKDAVYYKPHSRGKFVQDLFEN